MTDTLDGSLFLSMVRGGGARLNEHRKTINDLNVFPIPDGDTGDNMYMTLEAGSHAADGSLGMTAAAVSQGMLMGARGNSGVILSRIFAGIAEGLAGKQEAGVRDFENAMECAVKASYKAVATPVEGTILTVLREGVEAARESRSFDEYFDRLIPAMERSLQHTPELLAVLKQAGVVDSGGAGLLYVAKGMRAALHGEVSVLPETASAPARHIDLNAFTEDSVLEFGYCTEFLLRLQRSKVDPETFDERIIADWLSAHGDSLVFFRDGTIIKVHVHTHTPGEILNHCQRYGEFLTLKIENMTLQHHENHMDERFHVGGKTLGVVAVAAGARLMSQFREMGADEVIEGGQTMNPPVQAFLEAFDRTGAENILVLPNNGNIVLTARQAAEMYDKARVEVLPTHSLGEGYYALASLDRSETLGQILPELEEALEGSATGFVSRAIRDSRAGHTGDFLGMSGKDIRCASPERKTALLELARSLEAGNHDIALLLSGEDVSPEEAAGAAEALTAAFPRTETTLVEGGQPVYDYILLLC
ncbi:MAG: DAK2 domain-containing protein [Bacteroidales bacterium]|nr:DAK2 domain-containing protein [Bacteroidales bacterium]